MKYSVLSTGCMLAGFMLGAQLPAQQLAALESPVLLAQTTPVSTSKLDTRLSVDLTQVKLGVAIEAIARLSGVQIMYSKSTVPVDARVSVRGTNITVGQALAQVLKETSATVHLTQEGNVVVAPAAKQSDNKADGVVTGRVLHAKTKQPIVGAIITVEGMDHSVTTDADGTFRIVVPSGERTIQVRSVGFSRQSKKVRVGDDASVTIEFVLEPSASVLNEVIVTGTVVATERKAIATPITVITAEDIEKRGITRVEQLFRGEVPGVIALERGALMFRDEEGGMVGSQVYSRGASKIPFGFEGERDANPLKVFVDGVELTNSAYLGSLDPNSIERIEIVSGPQAATIYGSGAMGGVMQIFTKKGSAGAAPELTAAIQYGILQSSLSTGLTPSHNDRLGVRGSTGPGFSYSADVSYRYTGQWQPYVYNRTMGTSAGVTVTQGPMTVTGSFSLTSGENGVIGGGYYYTILSTTEREKVMAGEWAVQTSSLLHRQKRSRSLNQIMAFNADYRVNGQWQHHITAGRSTNNFLVDPQSPNYQTPRDSLYYGSKADGARITVGYNTTVAPWADRVVVPVLTMGVNGSWGEQTSFSAHLVDRDATAWLTSSIARPADTKSWGGFASLRLGILEQLYVNLGLRGERNPAYGRSHGVDWTPTQGVAYSKEFGEMTIKVMMSYGRSTRPPAQAMRDEATTYSAYYTPATYVSQFESPNLRPEYSRGPQGGIEIYYGSLGSFSINRYVQNVTDLIQRIGVDSIRRVSVTTGYEYWTQQNQYINFGRIRQHGVEATASLRLWDIALKGTYSWNDSRVVEINPEAYTGNGAITYHVGMPLHNVPTHTGNVTASYSVGKTSLTLVTNYVGASTNETYTIWEYPRLRMYFRTLKGLGGRGRSSPGYLKSDLSAMHRLTPWLSATVNITNLGNSFSSEMGMQVPSLGRQTLLGLSMRYPTSR